MNANEKVTTATKLKSRVIKYPLFETRVCVLQRIGRATIKDEFFFIENRRFQLPILYAISSQYFDTINFYQTCLPFSSIP